MSTLLGQLPQLNRLDLSGNPLGGCLSTLVAEIRKPLEYLSLHKCGLLDSDLFYLAGSVHTSVEHLDLSDNRLTRFSDALIVLLKRCAKTLYVLELDDNRFDCIDYLTIVCVARKMPRLKILATKGTFEVGFSSIKKIDRNWDCSQNKNFFFNNLRSRIKPLYINGFNYGTGIELAKIKTADFFKYKYNLF